MKKILFLLLFTIASYGQAVFDEGIQITNTESTTAAKVNVQEANGKVNTQTIKTGFNKNIGLGGSDVVGANTLLNQYSTTPVDWTATAFNSGQVVFYGGKQWIAKIATVAGDVPAVSSKWEEITFEALANKTVTVDQTIIDGSTNAVSGNAVFDALATKAPISSVHNPVTLGTPNGLSLSNQQISLGLASSDVTGALSGTDWNIFKNKQDALGYTPENVANKSDSYTVSSTITYPNTKALVDGLSTKLQNSATGIIGGVLRYTSPTTVEPSRIHEVMSKVSLFGLSGGFTTGDAPFISFGGNDDFGLIRHVFGQRMDYSSYHGFNFLTSRNTLSPINAMTIDVNGNVLINKTTDNGVDKVQVNGTISASPATTANQVPTWGQVQAAALPYKLYTFYVNQSGANIPTSVNLSNNTTLPSTPTWERTGVGDYRFFIGTVNTTKVFPYAVQSSWTFGNDIYAANVQGQYIQITRRTNGVLTDGLINILFEIRQYP